MYTTESEYPWYHTLQPITIGLPHNELDLKLLENQFFRYRYAIHRGGRFYRYEKVSDASTMPDPNANANNIQGDDGDIAMEIKGEEEEFDDDDDTVPDFHQLPLRLLANHESYVVNDVLGKVTGPPHIEHREHNTEDRTSSVASLHSRNSSFGKNTSSTLLQSTGSGGAMSSLGKPATSARKKAVGFAPTPPPYHRPKAAAAFQAVHLNSTDGLVVVSVFLPVILHRSDQGKWAADWDYEALLSMQTHLRVTRIGVVKWRGWHGNFGMNEKRGQGSPEAGGVPVNERHLVEECLRPFNCVPVWMDTSLFGEMYVLTYLDFLYISLRIT